MRVGVFPEDTRAFDAWASAHIPGFVSPSMATKFPTGQSNPTYLITSPGGRYVLRRKPLGKLLKSAHMVEREFRVIRALNGAGYPAPIALAMCEDESVAGAVFYLMSHVEGRIFWDPGIPEVSRGERAGIYDAMNDSLVRLHAVDIGAAGLGDFGKPGNYFGRQWQRWTEQYRASETSEIADMNRLIDWLGANMFPDDGRVALVHGDYRIDNMIFDNRSPRLLAVLDWELSTLGHPFADLAYQCMQWRFSNEGDFRGLLGLDRVALGIPSEEAYVADYCRRAGLQEVPRWPFLIAFSFFRIAAICQGVYKRALDGNASNPDRAHKMGAAVPMMAKRAMETLAGPP
jgi:aminoglycoside phosphotransferase (APT) family kinase protein